MHTPPRSAKQRDAYLQLLRGCAITAIVIIHTLPESTATIVVRPFLNWGVALFLFLSGLLTPRSKVRDLKNFYGRRVHKILIPYLVWTAVYLLSDVDKLLQLDAKHSVLHVAKAIISGNASAQLYYCVVYLCLVILTPVIYWILDSKFWWLAYIVTPVTLAAKYLCTPFDLPSVWGPFFGTWMIFYVTGLEWDTRFRPIVQRHGVVFWGFVAFAFTMLQMGEGFLWELVGGHYDVATSQLKLSSMAASLMVVMLVMRIKLDRESTVTGHNIMVKLGDLSFGIYLSHIIVVRLVLHFLPNINVLTGIAYGLITLIITASCVAITSRVLPKRIRRWIGFV